jgi:hypothetical protein
MAASQVVLFFHYNLNACGPRGQFCFSRFLNIVKLLLVRFLHQTLQLFANVAPLFIQVIAIAITENSIQLLSLSRKVELQTLMGK